MRSRGLTQGLERPEPDDQGQQQTMRPKQAAFARLEFDRTAWQHAKANTFVLVRSHKTPTAQTWPRSTVTR